MKLFSSSVLSLALLVGLVGCGTPKLSVEEQKNINSYTPKQIAELDEKMQRASSDDALNFYAPLSYIDAQKSYKKFDELKGVMEKREKQYAFYVQTEKYLDHGLESKDLVKEHLNKLLVQKIRLEEQNTFDNFEERYNDFVEALNKIIVHIDKREMDEVNIDANDLYAISLTLYADNMSFNYLNKYHKILETLDDESLSDNIPRQYGIAQKQFKKSALKIKSDPDNSDLCKQERLKTKNEVLYAQLLAHEVKELMDRDTKSYELYLDAWHRSHEKIYLRSSTEGTILYLPRDEKVNIIINSMQ